MPNCNCPGDSYCPICQRQTVNMTIRMQKEMKVRLGRIFDQSMSATSRNGSMISVLNMVLAYFETGELEVFRPLSTWTRMPDRLLHTEARPRPTEGDWDNYLLNVVKK